MATPLLMIGPGGDYASRYFVKGAALARQVGSTLAQQPDTETAGSFAGYGQSGRRRPSPEFSDAQQATPDGDAFEHGPMMPAATYGVPQPRKQQAGAQVSVPAATAAAAAEAWLAAQQRALGAIPLFSPAPPVAPATRPQPVRVEEPATRRIPVVAGTELSRVASPAAYRTAMAAWPRITASVAPPLAHAASRTPNDAHKDAHEDVQQEWTPQSAEQFTDINHNPLNEQDLPHESHPETTSHPHPNSRLAVGAGLLADDAGAGRRTGRQQSHRLRAHRGAHSKGSALARCEQGTLFNS